MWCTRGEERKNPGKNGEKPRENRVNAGNSKDHVSGKSGPWGPFPWKSNPQTGGPTGFKYKGKRPPEYSQGAETQTAGLKTLPFKKAENMWPVLETQSKKGWKIQEGIPMNEGTTVKGKSTDRILNRTKNGVICKFPFYK